MATYKKTENLSYNDIQDMISELEEARSIQDDIEKEANIASKFFALVGIPILFMATPAAMAIWAASIISGGYAGELQDLEDLCTNAISELEDMEDFLQNHSDYNMIRVEETIRKVVYSNETYEIPINFEVVAIHCTNPAGWEML
ncbi:hypothetical protein [Sedimentibacter sp. MB31-C6]|uniref:hypothetical protein n=1 Tax=Sedimentibacter sp. MB31-C6 TaxID=3109366 RepID=UPI002DDD8BBD|nr:hypothetical protein [Sedimentibacter sp. MB36-C1]WSI04596.1 hypothetical protein U8307_02080 [Sedimentibacter sp. MB36-C1]